jgi:ATP phosphoribosyltransferase regulatory subunit
MLDERARGASAPRGFRDILPTEARELRAIEVSLNATFAGYGFVPLEPPAVEHAARPAIFGEGRTIQFLDRDGRLVELRPDVTTAVARLVAQRYRDASDALRLSYFTSVFREQPAMSGGEREFVQAGVELIGPGGPLADAEALAVCVEAIERCGLSLDADQVHVGNVALVRRLFADLADDARELVLAALRGGDQVGALSVARDGGMSQAAVERARHVLGLVGKGIEEVGDDGDVVAIRDVIHYARELYPGTPQWGLPNLSLAPELPYYTGVVFEVVHPALGEPIASGGRYDLLLAAFGAPRPATGFAINVGRLHRALFADGWRLSGARALVALRPGADDRVSLRCAAALRASGVAVALGAVAESAGQPIVVADVVDDRRVRLADGRTVEAAELARELAT